MRTFTTIPGVLGGLILAWLCGCSPTSTAGPIMFGDQPAATPGLVMPAPAWHELCPADAGADYLAWLEGRNDRLLGSTPSERGLIDDRLEIRGRDDLWVTGRRPYENSRTTIRIFRRNRVR
jgi:hypothetical protein